MRLPLILASVLAFACPAFAQGGARAVTAPELPAGAYAHWHAGKTLKKGGELTLVDLVGSSHLTTSDPAFSLLPTGGIAVDGSQVAEIRATARQPIGKRFVMGIDVRFDEDGVDHQTIAYLFRFAEFRYRKSRGELTFNVWQSSLEAPGTEVVTSVRLPLPVGKWARVRGVIEDGVARLEIDGEKAEVKLPGSWEFLPQTSTLLVGKGGADRVFKGRFDHLYLALTP